MKNKTLLKISALALFAGIVFTIGCGKHHSFEKRADYIEKKLISDLKLDEKQTKELSRLKTDVLNKRQSLNVKQHLPDSIIENVKSDKPIDQKKINSYLEEQMDMQTQLRTYVVEKFAEFHTMLTPNQRQILAEKIVEMNKRMGDHFSKE